MPEALTDLERRALDYVVEYLRANTYQPSIREIGRTFGIKSTKTVSELLQSLADKGWIERDPSRSRGVRLLGIDLQSKSISVPLQGQPTATQVVNALELDEHIAARGTFLVMMPDDGMAASGIQRGDMLLVEPVTADQLEDGDIALATSGTQTLVRRYLASPVPRLAADNPVETPMVLGASAVRLDGRVISVVRRLRAPAVPAPNTISAAPAI